MPIEADIDRGNPRYRLSDTDGELVVAVGRGKNDVAYLKSTDHDFLELAKKYSEDGTATKIGLKNALEDLDLKFEGDARIVGIFPDETSVLLGADTRITAGKKWGGEKQLYPVEE